jgi:transposase
MVVLGIDPHKQTHTAVAVDVHGRKLAQLTVPAHAEGHVRLAGWARQHGQDRLWAVEDCRHVAGGLVRALLAAGERVVMVPPKLMAKVRESARTRGKSDPIDALAVARAALREPDLPTAQLDGPELDLRLLVDHRDDLVAERTRKINRLRWHLHDLDPDLNPPAGTLTHRTVAAELHTRLRDTAPSTRRDIALDLLDTITSLTTTINQLQHQLTHRVDTLAPTLRAIVGVGPLTAAKLIGETAGTTRFTTSARFAAHAGLAPIPVWTSNRTKHRLNRGGNRQLNAAVHRVAITQLRIHKPARDLIQRRQHHHHDTKAGALRVLKRHLADVLYTAMITDEQTRTTTPTTPHP